jgi:hypothetical protein
MKHAEKITPVAAALSALATLACCLPITFAAGTATAGLAAVAGSYRWALLGASMFLLALGTIEVVRARHACRTRGTASVVILGLSAAIVLLVLAFPQVIAGLLADWMP